MQCTKPIKVYVNAEHGELILGCGKCLHCRVQKRKEWSMRLWHELAYHDKSVFLTLTYADAHMPDNESLRLKDLQLFFKRLRKSLDKAHMPRIKYFACGEYGTNTLRPHYHAIVYGIGLDRKDKRMVIDNWPYCDWTVDSIRRKSFGIVEAKSINYVAGYIHSKLSGREAREVYDDTGREPVFRILSQGLGKQFAIDNRKQLQEQGCVTMNGIKHAIPRYYINTLGLDIESIQEQAKYKECEMVEQYSGLNMTLDDLNDSGDIRSKRMVEMGILRNRKARAASLAAQIALKDSKL